MTFKLKIKPKTIPESIGPERLKSENCVALPSNHLFSQDKPYLSSLLYDLRKKQAEDENLHK